MPQRHERRLLAALLVLALYALAGNVIDERITGHVSLASAAGAQSQQPNPGDPPKRPKPTDAQLSAGDIPLLDFLRFIHVATGRMVSFPSDDPVFGDDVMIHVLSDIEHFTLPIAEAILSLNGYLIIERVLKDDRRVYELTATQSRQKNKQLRIGPIVTGGPGLAGLADKQISTLVYPLEHVEPGDVVTILKDLLEVDAQGETKVVSIPTSSTIIAKAPARVLKHLTVLLGYVDVEPIESESLLRVFQLDHADALDMVDLLGQALEQFSGRSLRTPTPRAGSTPGTARSGSTGGTRRTTSGRQGSEATSIIPDARTQKLIVQSTSPSEVDLIETLIGQLDVKYTGASRHTRVYAVQYHRASTLSETLTAWLTGSGLDQRFRVVAHDPSNTIIIRSTDQRYGAALNQLIELDVPRSVAAGTTKAAEFEIRSLRITTGDAREVAKQLAAKWKQQPAVRIRVHAPSRTLVLRAPPRLIDAVLASAQDLAR